MYSPARCTLPLAVLVVSTVKAQWLSLSFRPLTSFALDLKASFRAHLSFLNINELLSNSTPIPGDLSDVPPSLVGVMSVASDSPQSSFPLPLSTSVDEETSSGCSGRVGAAEVCLRTYRKKRQRRQNANGVVRKREDNMLAVRMIDCLIY